MTASIITWLIISCIIIAIVLAFLAGKDDDY